MQRYREVKVRISEIASFRIHFETLVYVRFTIVSYEDKFIASQTNSDLPLRTQIVRREIIVYQRANK